MSADTGRVMKKLFIFFTTYSNGIFDIGLKPVSHQKDLSIDFLWLGKRYVC